MSVHTPETVVVLMADDDEDDREMAAEAFAESHLVNDLRFVTDGAELLDYLYQRNEFADPALSPRPGIILLDLNMPRMNGHEAMAVIKKDPDLRSIPIVVLTTSQAEADILASYNLGANSFITKPVRFNELVRVLQTLGDYWLQIVRLPGKGERHD